MAKATSCNNQLSEPPESQPAHLLTAVPRSLMWKPLTRALRSCSEPKTEATLGHCLKGSSQPVRSDSQTLNLSQAQKGLLLFNQDHPWIHWNQQSAFLRIIKLILYSFFFFPVMNKNSSPTYRSSLRSPNWIYTPRTSKQWLKRAQQYQVEVSEPYCNTKSKVIDLESLTVTEVSLFVSKVENLETAEKLE